MDDLFDRKKSKRLKVEGMAAAADNNVNLLEIARGVAEEIALSCAPFGERRCCHADLVGRRMKAMGFPSLGPAAGSIFKGKQWRFTGERVLSARVSNHSRELKVWEYIG